MFKLAAKRATSVFDYGEAERHLLEAVRLRPAFAAAWNNLGVLHLQQNAPAQAIRALEQGIAAVPTDEMLYLNLGRVYAQSKKFAEARAVMERLLKVQPQSAVARKGLEDLANAQP